MQRRAAVVILTASCFGVGASYRLGATAQKPVVERRMDLPNRNTMQTLEQLWAAAAVVIDAQVESSRTTATSNNLDSFKAIYTFHELRTGEVFKADGRIKGPNQVLTMRQTGGDIDRGDRIERYIAGATPLLNVGGRYILFLIRHDVSFGNIFYSTEVLSDDGIFEVRGATVQTPSKRPVATGLASRGTTELVRRLRELRGSVSTY